MILNKDTEDFQISEFVKVLAKRKFKVLSCIVIFVVLTALISYRMKPVYKSTVQILIDREAPKALQMQPGFPTGGAMGFDFYKTQYELLKSRALAKNVIQRLGLEDRLTPKAGDARGISLYSFRRWLEDKMIEFGIREKLEGEDVASDPYTSLVNRFLGNLEINPIRGSRLVKISYMDHSPSWAAEIANSFAEVFILKKIEMKSSMEAGVGHWLDARIGETKAQLSRTEKILSDFKESKKLTSIDERRVIANQKLTLTNSELNTVKSSIVEKETLKSQLELRQDEPIELLLDLPDQARNLNLKSLDREYREIRKQLSEKSKKLGPKHPKIASLSQEIKSLEERIPPAINRMLRSLEIDLQSLRTREESLLGRQIEQRKGVIILDRNVLRFNSLKRDVESDRRMYEVLLQRQKETDIESKQTDSNVRIVDVAEVPISHIEPNISLNIGLSFGLGTFFGIFLAFFLESLDRTLRTEEDMENQLPYLNLGSISKFSRSDGDLPLKQNIDSPLMDEFRMLRTNLMNAVPGNPKKVLMIASATPKEGKSTLVSNLALAMAHLGKKVLILDADLRRPKIHFIFNIHGNPGIAEAISGKHPLNECIHSSGFKNVSILPGGESTENMVDLLNSIKFGSLISYLRDNYDLVLIDVPPVLPVSDVLTISKSCDGIIFVVKAGENDVRLTHKALKKIVSATGGGAAKSSTLDRRNLGKVTDSAVSHKIIGVVLNMIEHKSGKAYNYYENKTYGYYGNYGGEIYSDSKTTTQPKKL
jgi:polysaccharide biosynthesis transport protein